MDPREEEDATVAEPDAGAGTPVTRWRWPLPAAGTIGLVIAVGWLVIAFIGPSIAPHDPGAVVDQNVFDGMSRAFPFGTDYLGRDVLSRILGGARYTVGVALMAACIASLAGATTGMFSAVNGGWMDNVASRAVDGINSIPSLLFGLVVVAVVGTTVPALVGTLAVLYAPGAFRMCRALSVNVNTTDFVAVARARGEKALYVVWAEILPNIIGPVLADFGLRFVFIVLLLSGLSFLGLGVQPPHADWGALVRENISGLPYGAPAVIVPSIAIATLTISVNLVIDSLPHRREPGSGDE